MPEPLSHPEQSESGDAPMTVEDRYLYGNVEAASKILDRQNAALEHLRACEVEGVSGADDQVVLDALFSYEAFRRANV